MFLLEKDKSKIIYNYSSFGVDLVRDFWYYAISYTTDGSGINHMEYNHREPTVWAKSPDD